MGEPFLFPQKVLRTLEKLSAKKSCGLDKAHFQRPSSGGDEMARTTDLPTCWRGFGSTVSLRVSSPLLSAGTWERSGPSCDVHWPGLGEDLPRAEMQQAAFL